MRSITVALTLALLASCSAPAANAPPPKPQAGDAETVLVGQSAPSFTRRAADGATLTVPSPHGPSVVLFWATWSMPDVLLLAELQNIAKGRPNVTFVGVNIDDEQPNLEEVARRYGVTFPIVWDERHELARAYRPSTDPSTFVLDERGRVTLVVAGYSKGREQEIDDKLAALLHEDPCAPALGDDAKRCARQCIRRTAAHCAQDGCERSCIRASATRNRALATCRAPLPKTASTCNAECRTEARGQAFDVCLAVSRDQPEFVEECHAICGIGSCYAACGTKPGP